MKEEEHAQLLERLSKAEQAEQNWRRIAAESQAEAAVYRDLLEEFCKDAHQARVNNDFSLFVSKTWDFPLPRNQEAKQWGKYFLESSRIDAGWLEDTKRGLERIKVEANKFAEENKIDAEAERVLKRIVAIADECLIEHV